MSVWMMGATGLVGSKVLDLLQERGQWVGVLGRSKPENLGPKTKFIQTDYSQDGDWKVPNYAVGIICHGTTHKIAGSKEAFHDIEVNMPLRVAARARRQGFSRIVLLSSVGASEESSSHYLKCKAELENKIRELGYDELVIVRPSMLLGKRRASDPRPWEGLGQFLFSKLSFLMPSAYKGVSADTVAQAIVSAALRDDLWNMEVWEGKAIQDAAVHYHTSLKKEAQNSASKEL